MKYLGWLVSLLLVALIAMQIALWHGRYNPAILAVPQSVVLDRLLKPVTPPSQDTELAGLTADDIVRGLLVLLSDGELTLSPEQAETLLPLVSSMNQQRYQLLTLRNERHAANEAAMEDTLTVAHLLTQQQIEAMLDGLTVPEAATEQEWRDMLSRIEPVNPPR